MRGTMITLVVATAALAAGSVPASAVPPDQALPQSCHGSQVSTFAHVIPEIFGQGLGRAYHDQLGPGALGEQQRDLAALCKTLLHP